MLLRVWEAAVDAAPARQVFRQQSYLDVQGQHYDYQSTCLAAATVATAYKSCFLAVCGGCMSLTKGSFQCQVCGCTVCVVTLQVTQIAEVYMHGMCLVVHV